MTERQCKTAENLARDLMTRTERLYNMRSQRIRPVAGETLLESPPEGTSHLWEHSRLVAGLARRLAGAEGTDGNEAYLAGLLHDAGKFAGGRYHDDDVPEERASAAAATNVLKKSGFGPRLIRRVGDALESLYREAEKRNRLADIVHDADFLAKSGRLGVAHFFIKSTLRGRDLARMVTESLSRELTYAAALPANMRTAAGRRLARSRAEETRRYFRGLLREIEEARGIRFQIRRLKVRLPAPGSDSRLSPGRNRRAAKGAVRKAAHAPEKDLPFSGLGESPDELHAGMGRISAGRSTERNPEPPSVFRDVPVTLVHPASCELCGGRWRLDVSTEKGLKCERLEARLSCSSCGFAQRTSFCLPEISRPSRPAARR
ncbi:MAG: HD domain-containing protein [Candidatus Aminicenantes bacterium]|nr:HD domain-containing protein [Candidatus Aminicenantes bacterium]